MNIIISGGAGFIGSHVVDLLLQKKHNILVLDNFSTGKMENLNVASLNDKNMVVADCDITKLPQLLGFCINFKPDAIIHLAAQSAITTAIENPVKDACVNVIGTLNILHVATQADVKRLVFSSTSAVYEESRKKLRETHKINPSNPYGISKAAAEYYIRTFFSNHAILRYGNVYGPRQTPIGENQVLARMIRHFKYGDTFYIHGDGNQKRDFIYVGEVAAATVSALFGKSGTYNVASGVSFSVNEMATFLEKAYYVDGYPWEHTEEQDPRRMVQMDVRLAKKDLRWQPSTHIREGIRRTVDWWESQDE